MFGNFIFFVYNMNMLLASLIIMFVACVALMVATCFAKKRGIFFYLSSALTLALLIVVNVLSANFENGFNGFSIILIVSIAPLFLILFGYKIKDDLEEENEIAEEAQEEVKEEEKEENKEVIKRETKVRKIKQRKSLYELFNLSNGRIFETTAFLLTSFLVAFSGLYVGKTSPFGMLLGVPMCIIGICIIYLGDREANILDVVSCAFTYLSVGMLIGQIISALIYGFTLATLFYAIGSLCLASYILTCQYTKERRINIILYFSYIMFAIAILMF